ncbi:MAG TPA: CPBP family intramembrane glutamic endopeptidase [Acidimicrobiia bacterium]|jgi:membrane protease YdiL (CAAX protease family)
MSDRIPPLALLAAYNVVQNTLLPQAAYVPSNLVATAALITQARSQGCSWDDLGLDLREARRSLAAGLVGVSLTAGVMAAASLVPATQRYLVDERARGHERRAILFRSLIRFPLGTALFEEVAFRGVLYGSWRKQMSPARAALLTAAAFGVWHLLPGRTALAGNPLQASFSSKRATATAVLAGAAVTGVSSLLLTKLRVHTRSLLAPWLVHAGVNSIGFLGGVVAWRHHTQAATR